MNTTLIETLKEKGRAEFDFMQANLTSVIAATDEELAPRLAERNEVFGGEVDCEGWRAEARRTQDDLYRQGRQAFAVEYAETQIKNL